MYHYEYNGGTYVGEYGLYYPAGNAYGGQNVVLGNSNWNWGSSVYTTSSTTNTQYNYLNLFLMDQHVNLIFQLDLLHLLESVILDYIYLTYLNFISDKNHIIYLVD